MPRKIKLIKIPKRLIKILENYLYSKPTSYINARNKLIIGLFYFHGLRTLYVRNMKVRDYTIIKHTFTVPYDYTYKKISKIPVDEPIKSLFSYILHEKNNPDSPMFKNLADNLPVDIGISIRQIQRIVKEELERLYFKENLPPRMLRHLCGIHYAKSQFRYNTFNYILTKSSPWAFTEYKRRAGTYRRIGKI